MSLITMLKDTVSIYRQAESITSREKVLAAESTVATGVLCLIQGVSGELRDTIFGRLPMVTKQIFFNSGQDIQENDRVNDGTTNYLVKEVIPAGSPGIAHHIETLCEVMP